MLKNISLRRISEPLVKPVLALRRIALVLVCVMPEVLIYHMLHPLFPYMAQALRPDDANLGYYVGLLQSAYFLPTIISAPLMGHLSDVVGRRHVLLVGLAGYGVGSLLLGLAVYYWLAVVAMVCMGCFSGNATVAKSMIGEQAKDEESRAFGYSAYGVAYALCAIGGAILGTQLADTPKYLQQFSFLQTRPYFFACACGFILALVCLCFTVLLTDESDSQTTSSTSLKYPASPFLKKLEDPIPEYSHTPKTPITPILPPPLNITLNSKPLPHHASNTAPSRLASMYSYINPYLSILNRHTLAPLALYTLYALTNSLLHTAIPLLSASSADKGGYGLPAARTAQIATYTAAAKLCAKVMFLGIQGRVGGALGVYRIGTVLLGPAVAVIGGWIGGGGVGGSGEEWLVAGLVGVGVGESWVYLALVMLITEGAQGYFESVGGGGVGGGGVEVDSESGVGLLTGTQQVVGQQQQRQGKAALGLVHGVSGCLAAIVRTVGPAIAGVLWEVFGGGVLLGVVIVIIGVQVVLSFVLFRSRRFRNLHS